MGAAPAPSLGLTSSAPCRNQRAGLQPPASSLQPDHSSTHCRRQLGSTADPALPRLHSSCLPSSSSLPGAWRTPLALVCTPQLACRPLASLSFARGTLRGLTSPCPRPTCFIGLSLRESPYSVSPSSFRILLSMLTWLRPFLTCDLDPMAPDSPASTVPLLTGSTGTALPSVPLRAGCFLGAPLSLFIPQALTASTEQMGHPGHCGIGGL